MEWAARAAISCVEHVTPHEPGEVYALIYALANRPYLATIQQSYKDKTPDVILSAYSWVNLYLAADWCKVELMKYRILK